MLYQIYINKYHYLLGLLELHLAPQVAPII